MKVEKDKLSQSFKDKLGGYSQEVNTSLWINIQADIKRSRLRRLRSYYMSAASVVLLLGLLTGFFTLSDAPITRISPMIEQDAIIADNSAITVVESKIDTPELLAVLDGKKRESIVELREKSNKINIELRPTIKKKSPPSEMDSNKKEEKKESATKKRSLPKSSPIMRESLWETEPEPDPKARSSKKLQLSFMGAGAFAESKSSISHGMLSIDVLDKITQIASDAIVLNQSSPSPLFSSKTKYKDYEYRYNIPFSFGASIRKDLSDGFSLETGVFATMLSTSFLIKGESNENIGTNTMWYLGVPIKANWSFFSRGNWSIYLSAGGAVEKCISSQYSGDKLYFQDLTVESSEDILARDFALQFSVNAAIGLQVKLADVVGLFFEPGVSYYFDAITPIPTIRTDRPFNINMQAGLRFSL